jgi:acetyl esterase
MGRAPGARRGPQMAAITESMVPASNGTVRVRSYDPGPDGTKPALIYLHGGGWALFSLDTHDRVMREYASRAGVVVIGVDYALAPEARYPVALEQVVMVARYVAAHGEELGVDPHRIAIGGDSAGANLALATSLRLRDDGYAKLIRGMLLNYGVFARDSSAEAATGFGAPGNMLTADEMDAYWRNYLRDERDAKEPYACPLRADLRGLPRTLLVVPECDLLTEQSVRLAELLVASGVAAQLEMYRGATHSFLEAVSISALANRAFDHSARWLRDTMGLVTSG